MYQYGLKELPEKTRKDEGLVESQQRGIPFTNSVQNNMFSFREADEGSENDQISQGFDGVPTTKESGNEMTTQSHIEKEVRFIEGERNQQAGKDFVSCVEINKFSHLDSQAAKRNCRGYLKCPLAWKGSIEPELRQITQAVQLSQTILDPKASIHRKSSVGQRIRYTFLIF